MVNELKRFFTNKVILKKILFTLFILMIYKVGTTITVPGVDATSLRAAMSENNLFAMLNIVGGGALERMSLFALGVSPYITASIIIQLLSMDVIPALTEMTKSGQKGKQQLDNITRYTGLVLGFVQAFSMVYAFDKQYGVLQGSGFSSYIFTVMLLVAGSQLLIWLGDRISVNGIGNGLSMIIFAGIVSNLPSTFAQVFNIEVANAATGSEVTGWITFIGFCLLYLAIIVGVVIMQLAIRKIPIQYSNGKAANGTNMSYLPFKINSASVIPVIFAGSVLTAPQILLSFINYSAYEKVSNVLSLQKPIGLILYAVLTFAFTFFYTDLQMDTDKISENLHKSGAYIPGIRPGADTRTYLKLVIHRITLLGAIALTVIAVLPYLLPMIIKSFPSNVSIGGTGIIIVVGVAIETINTLKTQQVEHKYSSFLR